MTHTCLNYAVNDRIDDTNERLIHNAIRFPSSSARLLNCCNYLHRRSRWITTYLVHLHVGSIEGTNLRFHRERRAQLSDKKKKKRKIKKFLMPPFIWRNIRPVRVSVLYRLHCNRRRVYTIFLYEKSAPLCTLAYRSILFFPLARPKKKRIRCRSYRRMHSSDAFAERAANILWIPCLGYTSTNAIQSSSSTIYL